MSNTIPQDGPKITIAAIEREIRGVTYSSGDKLYGPTAHDPLGQDVEEFNLRTLTVATVLMRNGAIILGTSNCVDPSNYDAALGRKYAYEDAIKQIWPLMGYELRSKLTRIQDNTTGSDSLGEALTRMMALSLGNPLSFRGQDATAILSHFEGTDHQEEGELGETYATVPLSDEHVAQICHEANRAYCKMMGMPVAQEWGSFPQNERDVTIAGVRFHRDNPGMTPEQSHANWLKDKKKDGWRYGPEKDAVEKTHPCMVPFEQLPESQQFKDTLFITLVHAADNQQ